MLLEKQEFLRIVQQASIQGVAGPEHQHESSRGDHKRMQEDKEQSGSTYSHDQKEKKEMILQDLVEFDKDINVYLTIIKHNLVG